MENQFFIPRTPKHIPLTAWSLIALAIFSCCCRPDYNVIIGFLVLLLRSFDANENRQFFIKAGFHILILACLFDIFWIFKYRKVWTHGEETSELWQSLAVIHNLAYYSGFLEFLLKFPIIVFYYNQFKLYGTTIGELFNMRYKN